MRFVVAGAARNNPLDQALLKWLREKPTAFSERFTSLEEKHEATRAAWRPERKEGVGDGGTEKVKELLEGEWLKLETFLERTP